MLVRSTKGKREQPRGGLRLLTSLTYFIFFTAQLCSIVWVSTSYGIAIYATVKLGQPFPVVELSQQAIITLLGVGVLKTVENIFEHNDGTITGKSRPVNEEGSSQD